MYQSCMREIEGCLYVGPSDRVTLERMIADGKTPQKIAKRASIVLLSGRGLGTNAICREARVTKPTVWRWQKAYMEGGVARLSDGSPVPCNGARTGPVLEGNVGGGTGMTCFEFAGGIGTASRQIAKKDGGHTVGVLVQANFGLRHQLRVAGVPVGKEIKEHAFRSQESGS